MRTSKPQVAAIVCLAAMACLSPVTARGLMYGSSSGSYDNGNVADAGYGNVGRPARVDILLPFYIFPSTDTTVAEGAFYKSLADAAAANKCVTINAVVNGDNNGPPREDLWPSYTAAFKTLSDAGVKLYGYVFSIQDTTNGVPRDVNAVFADIDAWYRFSAANGVPLTGIFIDQVTGVVSTGVALDFYSAIAAYIRQRPNKTNAVIFNPGTRLDCSIANLADIYVRFEDSYDQFVTATTSGSLTCDCSNSAGSVPATSAATSKCSALTHGYTGPQTPETFTDLAKQVRSLGFSFVYATDDVITDGNPWDTLPTFWTNEVQGVNTHNQNSRACGNSYNNGRV